MLTSKERCSERSRRLFPFDDRAQPRPGWGRSDPRPAPGQVRSRSALSSAADDSSVGFDPEVRERIGPDQLEDLGHGRAGGDQRERAPREPGRDGDQRTDPAAVHERKLPKVQRHRGVRLLDPGDHGLDQHVRRGKIQVAHEPPPERDRKSTRLNSSHEWISYAVFCLKKKKKTNKKVINKKKKKKKIKWDRRNRQT